MIFYLNRGLILEQEIIKALKGYFKDIAIDEMYQNYTVTITNEHPFALLMLYGDNSKAQSLFPVIVVASETDSKPVQLDALAVSTQKIQITEDDISKLAGMGYDITPGTIEKMKGEIAERDYLYGIGCVIRRSEHISVEIWAENPQLKNELYEKTRLFVAGGMKEALEYIYREYALTIFDGTIHGQRSNNFNLDFGITLHGAQIAFDADYMIEQTVINTELQRIDDPVYVEVCYGVKK
jgi:hypothetical protein